MNPNVAALMSLLGGGGQKALPPLKPKAQAKKPKPNLPKKPVPQHPSAMGGF